MFDVGFTEILLIGVVALVVIGPERLPDVARNVGRYVGKLQRFVTGVKRDIRAELETGELKKLIGDQKSELDELRKVVNSTRRDIDSGARSLVGDAKKTLKGLEDASAEPAAKPAGESSEARPAAIGNEASATNGGGAATPSALPDMASPAATSQTAPADDKAAAGGERS